MSGKIVFDESALERQIKATTSVICASQCLATAKDHVKKIISIVIAEHNAQQKRWRLIDKKDLIDLGNIFTEKERIKYLVAQTKKELNNYAFYMRQYSFQDLARTITIDLVISRVVSRSETELIATIKKLFKDDAHPSPCYKK